MSDPSRQPSDQDWRCEPRTTPWAALSASILASVGHALIGTDPSGIVQYWNAAAADLYGWSSEEAVGRLLTSLIDPEPTDETGLRNLNRVLGEERTSEELLARHRDGHRLPVLVTAMPWRDEQGVVIGVLTASVDVTELIDVTEGQRSSREVIDAFELMSDAYITIDGDWCFTFVNQRAQELLEHTREELLGELLWDMFPETIGSAFEIHFRHVVESGEPVTLEEFFPPLHRWFEVRVYPLRSGLSLYFHDVTERHEVDEERLRLLAAERSARHDAEAVQRVLEHAAMHDPLTGLANRPSFAAWITERLEDDRRDTLGVFFLDLDRFKYVNDSLGHKAGDDLLVEIAARLGRELASRPHVDGLVARVGGDEFVIGASVTNGEDARDLLEGVQRAVAEPADIHGRRLVTTTSVGVSFPRGRPDATAESLLRDADAALYKAKGRGRDQAAVFDDALRLAVVRRMELEAELRVALVTEELQVAYQPAFDLRTNEIRHIEALARWYHPTRGVVSPGEFIPIAEDTGLILPLGKRVLEIVGRDLAMREPVGGEPHFQVWVNVSGRQLADASFYAYLTGSGLLEGRHLGLEVTETVLLEDPRRSVAAIAELVEAGVKIAIDDFGTGYSSLARLTTYPIHVIKIDQSFVARVDEAHYRAIVASTIQLAHGLQTEVVAEGVETAEQLAILRRLGCDHVSGYYLARPTPITSLREANLEGIRRLGGRLSVDGAD